MATVIVSAWQAGKHGQSSASSTLRGAPRASQVITTTASNSASTIRAATGEVLMVSVSGGEVKLAFAVGATPDAAALPQIILGNGGALPVEASADDFRVAVADV
jgi:hypothetical protein